MRYLAYFRNVAASPLYLLAFALHLLCSFISIAALKIAGEEPIRRRDLIAVLFVVIMAATTWLASHRPQIDTSWYNLHAPIDYSGVKHGFAPEQMVWTIPLIRSLACVQAELAIKLKLAPALTSFPICGASDDVKIVMDDDLINISVFGKFDADGVEKSFFVKVEHYPPSVQYTGFIILSMDVD